MRKDHPQLHLDKFIHEDKGLLLIEHCLTVTSLIPMSTVS
jgi:hypothetical protein